MISGYGDGSGPVSRAGSGYPIQEHPTTPGPFGGPRNEGTIPGVGAAMPLSLPGLDVLDQGDQRHSIPGLPASSAPPLPPGPHPSLLSVTGGGSSGSSQQGLYQQMQIMSLPLPPPLLPPHQHPSHLPLLPHPHLPRPVSSVPGPLPTSVPLQSSMVRGFLLPLLSLSFILLLGLSRFLAPSPLPFFSPSVSVYIHVSFIWSIFISLSFYPWLCNALSLLLLLNHNLHLYNFFILSYVIALDFFIYHLYIPIYSFHLSVPFFLLPSLLTSLYLHLSLLFSLSISWILSPPLSFNLHQHLSFFMSIHCISLSFLSAPPSSFNSHSLILPLTLFLYVSHSIHCHLSLSLSLHVWLRYAKTHHLSGLMIPKFRYKWWDWLHQEMPLIE